MDRRIGVVLTWLVLGVILAGCGGSGSAGRLAKFSDHLLSFSYPSEWQPQQMGNADMHYTVVDVALSNEKLRSPCRVTSPRSSSCAISMMLANLPLRGVFVAWFESGGPGGGTLRLALPGATQTRVGGSPARLLVEPNGSGRPGLCPSGTSTSMTASIDSATGPPMTMVACMHGANFARFQAQVQAMLRSVSFRPPRQAPSHSR